ncbi:kinesin family protein [Aspergillus homomorphus CBS 101889]|uniref:P-loop containing nucleoside triphosphate hydrolase protein n=1 Tax=Aspergillus homomorphus (strain CBS 101889) TaxID=1450537 RepID=A0A395I2D6_ASPHC|nr:P-loop containing nucleoside triphosphate hydrolase protein [Aspergillus homomorphus CBS 101889]RAL13895.1 P-loop containing nucleoside triphosphate hydrolase protein [Aspergillus homomorphus CBS 101889]
MKSLVPRNLSQPSTGRSHSTRRLYEELLRYYIPGFRLFSHLVTKHLGLNAPKYLPYVTFAVVLSYAAKRLSRCFWKILRFLWTTTVEVSPDDNSYEFYMLWMVHNKPLSRVTGYVTVTDDKSGQVEEDTDGGNGLQDTGACDKEVIEYDDWRRTIALIRMQRITFTPRPGTYFYLYRGRLIKIQRVRIKERSSLVIVTGSTKRANRGQLNPEGPAGFSLEQWKYFKTTIPITLFLHPPQILRPITRYPIPREPMQPFSVFVRWRPLPPEQTDNRELTRNYETHPSNRISISLPKQTTQDRLWQSQPAFTQILDPNTTNKAVFDAVAAPTLPRVLAGGTSNIFAYGHSGSGKSHTMIGLEALNANTTNTTTPTSPLCIGLRMYELRGSEAFDLLNSHTRCHVREGSDNRTHIRGETETLEGGRFRTTLLSGLALRETGSSTMHDLSSRTHAVVEVEVVSRALLGAREAVIERVAELVPVGKRATDVYLEENMKAFVKDDAGRYVPNPEYTVNQARIDAAEAEKAVFEAAVQRAEEYVEEVLHASGQACLEGKLVFVDLTGSEFYHDKTVNALASRKKPPPLEMRQGRQINTDLLALKEVIRARASNASRIPYRASPLTLVLREHFRGDEEGATDSCSRMILTVSPAVDQAAATVNTLKYGSLVGIAAPEK